MKKSILAINRRSLGSRSRLSHAISLIRRRNDFLPIRSPSLIALSDGLEVTMVALCLSGTDIATQYFRFSLDNRATIETLAKHSNNNHSALYLWGFYSDWYPCSFLFLPISFFPSMSRHVGEYDVVIHISRTITSDWPSLICCNNDQLPSPQLHC